MSDVPPLRDTGGEGDESGSESNGRGVCNHKLELLTLQESSPRSLQEEDLCRTALTCHFALDIFYMSMEW